MDKTQREVYVLTDHEYITDSKGREWAIRFELDTVFTFDEEADTWSMELVDYGWNGYNTEPDKPDCDLCLGEKDSCKFEIEDCPFLDE